MTLRPSLRVEAPQLHRAGFLVLRRRLEAQCAQHPHKLGLRASDLRRQLRRHHECRRLRPAPDLRQRPRQPLCKISAHRTRAQPQVSRRVKHRLAPHLILQRERRLRRRIRRRLSRMYAAQCKRQPRCRRLQHARQPCRDPPRLHAHLCKQRAVLARKLERCARIAPVERRAGFEQLIRRPARGPTQRGSIQYLAQVVQGRQLRLRMIRKPCRQSRQRRIALMRRRIARASEFQPWTVPVSPRHQLRHGHAIERHRRLGRIEAQLLVLCCRDRRQPALDDRPQRLQRRPAQRTS